ncbi:hypothetical protein BHE74_00044491 [Ensete ventricosum]|nr:hypothetical protein GW17_00020706 [Ensete ventricosum]RWW49360.1 hypothetical protein BHE74_00044491 [Ensete ventricosum]RZS18834.1 hypothetical protein BHM03_00051165 [Ensete ventricosum]
MLTVLPQARKSSLSSTQQRGFLLRSKLQLCTDSGSMEAEAQALMSKRSTPSRFRRVCVFCGSSPGRKPSYQLAAIQLGHELVGLRLLSRSFPCFIPWEWRLARYIESLAAPSALGVAHLSGGIGHTDARWVALFCSYSQDSDASRGTHLAISSNLSFEEEHEVDASVTYLQITGETVGEVRAVSGMHQRKAEMARQADAFIALPGGYGTLEELLEVITWAQLGIHDKPVGLLNVDGYYDSLLSFIDKAVDEGFIAPAARHIIVSAQTPHELLSELEVPCDRVVEEDDKEYLRQSQIDAGLPADARRGCAGAELGEGAAGALTQVGHRALTAAAA